MDRLGRFPTVGDRVTVELPEGGRAVIDVRTLDRHVADRVRISPFVDAAEAREAEEMA